MRKSILWMLPIALLLLVVACKKDSNDNQQSDLHGSSMTLVLTAKNQDEKLFVVLLNLETVIEEGKIKNSLSGKFVKYSFTQSTVLDDELNSISYQLSNGTLLPTDDLPSLIVSRLKKISGYLKDGSFEKDNALDIINKGSVLIGYQEKGEKNIFNFIKSILGSEAYAQVPKGDMITTDIIKKSLGLVKSGLQSAGTTSVSVVKSIYDLGQSTKDLWDYVAKEIGDALDGKKTAEDVHDDIGKYKGSSNSSTSSNETRVPGASEWGDPHLTTFDGLYYDFQGYGEFIAVKSTTDLFEVQVRQEQEPTDTNNQVTFPTGIAINTGTHKVCIYPSTFYVDNTQYNFSNTLIQFGNNILEVVDNILTITTQSNDFIKVYREDGAMNYLGYFIQLNPNRKGNTYGLFGNFDENTTNDIRLRDNTSINPYEFNDMYPRFADSWRITQSLFVYPSGKNSASYTKKDFPKSRPEVDANTRAQAEAICRNAGVEGEPYFSNCVLDVSLYGAQGLSQGAVYAQTDSKALDSFHISNFSSYRNSILSGSSSIQSDGSLLLTPSSGANYGSMFVNTRVHVGNGFEAKITFSMSEFGGGADVNQNVGGDGLALVLHGNQNNPSNGATGGGLGYEGLTKSIAVEFDSYMNNSDDKPLWVNSQGRLENSANDVNSLVTQTLNRAPNYRNNQTQTAIIRYTKQNNNLFKLEVFMNNESLPYLVAIDLDILKLTGGVNNTLYIGLTGATEAAYSKQVIRDFSFKAY